VTGIPIEEFDQFMREAFPAIAWNEPIVLEGALTGYGCRLCIARLGLKAKEPEGKVWPTMTEAILHLMEVHKP